MLTTCHAEVQYLKHETPYIGGMVANLCWLFTRYFFPRSRREIKIDSYAHFTCLQNCNCTLQNYTASIFFKNNFKINNIFLAYVFGNVFGN